MAIVGKHAMLGTIMNERRISIRHTALPEDDGWSTADDMPGALRDMLELYACAKIDNVDGQRRHIEDVDELYELYDGLAEQHVVIAEQDDQIVGIASYDTGRQPAFFEGVAVAPEYRGRGIASALGAFVFAHLRHLGITDIHARSQPSSVYANTRLLQRTGLPYTIDDTQHYPLISINLT